MAGISYSQKDILPKQMTEYEKTIMDDYLSSFDEKGITTPPRITISELQPNGKKSKLSVITWTNQFNNIQKQIVDAAQEEAQSLFIVLTQTQSNPI